MYHLVSLAAKAALVAATSLSGHASAPAAYTVQRGDTLGSIAARNGGVSDTPGAGSIPSSYLSCVRFRESTNGAASSDQFGITPSSWSAYGFPGSPYTAPYSEQVTAFRRIYAAVGTSAWSPYDGC